MGSIIDYVTEYGTYSFAERPFSDEDALVFAQFSYMKLGGAVPELALKPDRRAEEAAAKQDRREETGAEAAAGETEENGDETERGVTLGGICSRKSMEKLLEGDLFAESNRALLEAMRASRRFQTVTYNYYVNLIDHEASSQFSAVTCFLPEGPVYVAFRGTDETLAGWREDFAMAYETPVPSQELAAKYLRTVAQRCRGAIIAGGHSKGGNLAVYAAMRCGRDAQERIRLVYNLDGPGFPAHIRDGGAYRAVESRIRKIVPHSSVVGMLFENDGAYEVVESNTFGVMQHNPFSWVVKEGKFAAVKDVYRGRKRAAGVLNSRLDLLTKEEAVRMIETFFQIVEASGIRTLPELSGDWKRTLKKMARAAADVDRETRRKVLDSVRTVLGASARRGGAAYEEESGNKIKRRK